MAVTSITLGFSTFKKSEHAVVPARTAATASERRVARASVVMGPRGSEGKVEAEQQPLRIRQREEVIPHEAVARRRDHLGVEALVVRPESQVLHRDTEIRRGDATDAREEARRHVVVHAELTEPDEVAGLQIRITDHVNRGGGAVLRDERRLAGRLVAVAAKALVRRQLV